MIAASHFYDILGRGTDLPEFYENDAPVTPGNGRNHQPFFNVSSKFLVYI